MFERETAVLIVEVDPPTRVFVADQLTADGARVLTAGSAEHARVHLRQEHVDLIVLGDLEPRPAAIDLLRELRGGDSGADRALPVLMLSAQADELAVVRAFDAGADDVMSMPFSYPELRARLRALSARMLQRRVPDRLRIGPLEVDRSAREVRVGDTPVELSGKEYALLVHLAGDACRVFTKDELLREVWGFRSAGRTRTLDSHACRLRAKLAAVAGDRFVVNVWGVGYRLVDSATIQLREVA